MITIADLKNMKPGIFAHGVTTDNPAGVNMTGSGQDLRWVATRGGIHDWAIYIHKASWSDDEVKDHGDKIHNREIVRKLVPCDNNALEMYRD